MIRAPLLLLLIALNAYSQDTTTYQETLAQTDRLRLALAKKWGVADTDKLVDKATLIIDDIIHNTLTPWWLGTPWDFNGTTREPGQGNIACGYFVTTLLLDAGFKIQRVKLAQLPSEKMIKSLVDPSHIRRYSNKSIETFTADAEAWGHGLYVVGLDQHTGFISVSQQGVLFIHSSYVVPYKVVVEKALESPILTTSKYRVLGKLTGRDLVEKWLKGQPFPVEP